MPHARTWCGSLAAITCIALPGASVAQGCAPAYDQVVRAVHAQVMEYGSTQNHVDYWVQQLNAGANVRLMVSEHLKWNPEYNIRFQTGHDERTILTYLFKHALAREPGPSDWALLALVPQHGWNAVIDRIIWSDEYNSRFGDHIVPGDPVVAWDCKRATGITVAHANGFRDAGQGGVSVSYTTPAYVSLDQPRSLTFTYYSGLADPRSLVQLNVLHASSDAPERVMLEVRNAEGARETLTDSALDVTFSMGQGASRVAAEFREPRHANASVYYQAVVRRYWRDGRSTEDRVPFVASNLTARESPFGYGWVLEGYQRLNNQSYGVHITEGATGTWFRQIGDAVDAQGRRHYESPSGDFSTVKLETDGYFHRRYPDGTRVRFTWDGLMVDHMDRFGNQTQYGHDTSGRLTRVVDPTGQAITLGYTGTGALAWVQDPAGRSVWTRTTGKLLHAFVAPDRSTALDLQFVDAGPSRGFVLESYWRGGSRSAGAATAWTYTYDAHGRVASLVAPQVKVTEAGVGTDVPMRPTERFRSLQAAVLGSGNLSNPVARVRPEAIELLAISARNDTTRMAVDALGAPLRVRGPLGTDRVYTRDRHGRIMLESGQGRSARYEYVGVELRYVDQSMGQDEQYEYEPRYHQVQRISVDGVARVWNYYDAEARLDSTRSGTSTSPVTRFSYATRGRIARVTDPQGHVTEVTYHATGSQNTATLRMPHPSGGFETTTMAYDAYGRHRKTILPSGDSTLTGYDANNRVTRTIDAEGRATAMEYNANGLWRLMDAKGQVYTWNRNLLGQVESEVDALGQATTFRYDRVGNQSSVTNRRNQTISFSHDALGRVRTRVADGAETRYDYSRIDLPVGSWVSAVNGESTDTVHMDPRGRVRSQVTWMNGKRFEIVSHHNELSGHRDQVLLNGGWERHVAYHYGSSSRLDSIRDFSGGITRMRYNDDGQVSGVWFPNGISRSSTYNHTHRITQLRFAGVASERLGETYGYDLMHRMEHRTNYAGDTLHIYGYDRSGQLTSDQRQVRVDAGVVCEDPLRLDSCHPTTEWRSDHLAQYSFDPAGNRGQATTGNRLSSFDGFDFEYDPDGNMTRKVRPEVDDLKPTWNSLGQLTGAYRHLKGTVSYGYNGFGQRVRRTGPDGAVTRYLYDGDDLFIELDGANNIVREYTYLPGVDQPLSIRTGGQTYYYASDALGHVTGLLDSKGQVVNRYEYTPWGEAVTSTEGVAQPLGYMAREKDPVTGLYYVRARWYDPHQGRFVSEDPIGLAGGLNVYAYVGNSPTNGTDPSGLAGCPAGTEFDRVEIEDRDEDGVVEPVTYCKPKSGVYNGGNLPGITVTARPTYGSLLIPAEYQAYLREYPELRTPETIRHFQNTVGVLYAPGPTPEQTARMVAHKACTKREIKEELMAGLPFVFVWGRVNESVLASPASGPAPAGMRGATLFAGVVQTVIQAGVVAMVKCGGI